MIYHYTPGDRPLHWFELPDAMSFWNQCDKPETGDMGRSSRTKGDSEFYGTKSYEEAIKLARYGWPEGVKAFKPVASKLAYKLGQLVEREMMEHDVTGDFPDISAFIQGDPENMIRMKPQIESGKGRIVKVVYNASASASVNKKILVARGSVACAMIDAISAAGYHVEIELCEWTAAGGEKCGVSFLVKRVDEPLNIERAAFCLAHPSMLRRMAFAVEETMPEKVRKTFGFKSGGGYGQPAEAPMDRRGDIYFGKMSGDEAQWSTPEKAEAAAIKALKKAGILSADAGEKQDEEKEEDDD